MEDVKMKISALWIFVMINMLLADILTLFIPASLEEIMTGTGPVQITPQLMLVAAIIIEIPIAMIFLSRVLKYRANRWANIIVAPIIILFVVGGGSTDPHYIFIATMEVLAMLLIIRYAWTFLKEESTQVTIEEQQISPT